LPRPLEYKYVKGDWENEELDVNGNKISNRKLSTPIGLIKDHVPHWEIGGLAFNKKLLPKIVAISDAFEIPQLIKTRRIAALLPHDYDQTNKRYPVLYLQDGQNLFDDFSPYGNWSLDKKLAILSEQGMGDIIIIAIDHAKEKRVEEFTPSYKTKLGVGHGEKYAQFLAETLKPYVDKYFRTLPGHKYTGIGGSSMGGLISLYAGLMYPDIYDKLMIFSPSLWVTENIEPRVTKTKDSFNLKIYLYAGGKEGSNMVPNVLKFKEALSRKIQDNSVLNFNLSIDPNGEHNEYRWGMEFPKAIKWLFFEQLSSTSY